jgi:hypothetical protein
MFGTEGFGYLIALRVAELFNPSANWTHRMWRYGTVAQLRELLDSAATRSPASARTFALSSARGLIGRDPAISGKRRGQLLDTLPNSKALDRFVFNSHSYWLLAQEVDNLEDEYIARWTELIISVGENTALVDCPVDVDLCGWLIGAHLRSSGLSDRWILNLCNYELKRKSELSSMVDLLEVADRLIRKGKETVQFLLPLAGRARFDPRTSLPWLARKDFRARFRELFPDIAVPSNRGGLQLQVVSLDKYSATKEASKLLARAEMRVSVSSNRRQLLHNYEAWMHPGAVKVDLTPTVPVDFRVPALDAGGGQLLFTAMSDEIEAAFDLLTGFQSGPERAACIGAWAALESLLADPADFGNLAEVADRAADILTCRYVTDEFVSLAIAHRRSSHDALAVSLAEADNTACVRLLEEHFRLDGNIAAGAGVGALMVSRVRRLIDNPSEIDNLRGDISAAFRRLYQARNQIVHTGALEPYGFDMIILSAQVLMSTLIDMTILAARTSGDPAGLVAARARWSLQRVRGGHSLSLLASV